MDPNLVHILIPIVALIAGFALAFALLKSSFVAKEEAKIKAEAQSLETSAKLDLARAKALAEIIEERVKAAVSSVEERAQADVAKAKADANADIAKAKAALASAATGV